MSLNGPTLPLPPGAPDGGYRGISCRPGPGRRDVICGLEALHIQSPIFGKCAWCVLGFIGAFHSGCNRRHRS